jgi:hypothetical protein
MWSLSFDEDGVCAFPAQTMTITHILLGAFRLCEIKRASVPQYAAGSRTGKIAGLYANSP